MPVVHNLVLKSTQNWNWACFFCAFSKFSFSFFLQTIWFWSKLSAEHKSDIQMLVGLGVFERLIKNILWLIKNMWTTLFINNSRITWPTINILKLFFEFLSQFAYIIFSKMLTNLKWCAKYAQIWFGVLPLRKSFTSH